MTGALSTACIVNRIVAKHLDVDPADLGPGLTFAKLGASDVDMIHIVMAVDYVLRAWSEAEDRRFSSTMWLHDFAPSAHSIEQVAA